ncbi:shikimate dehydrogenase [Synechococcus sp. M16CYN]|uniref:shikimate dehydrogenase n=1 Tax=Synechococcus sp. M16CYN TaxID=3103139 RepID=UPI0032473045
MINGGTGLVGLIGNPVRHSLSPAMHNAALKALGLDWCYLALPCKNLYLGEVLQGLLRVGCRGLNVTVPHKQNVASWCEELSPLAQRLGAVNTLVPLEEAGGWHGTNTDQEGFLTTLDKSFKLRNRQAVILGCGGSAHAIAAGLQSLGLASITVVGRRENTLHRFIQNIQHDTVPLTSCLESNPMLSAVLEQADLVVNTTPVGMAQYRDANVMPLGQEIWSSLQDSAILYDLIYTPRPTAWLAWGQDHGHQCIDGFEMLVQQGAASLRLWSGITDIPVGIMRLAAKTALEA